MNRFAMNIGVTAKGQVFDRALAIGSRTRWLRKELVGLATLLFRLLLSPGISSQKYDVLSR